MMLASDVVPDPWLIADHARLVLDGRVRPWLLWEKHPVFVVAMGLLALIGFAMLKRLIAPRRPRVIIERIPEVPPVQAPRRAPPPPKEPSRTTPPIRSGRSHPDA
jgi:hypothetical protein